MTKTTPARRGPALDRFRLAAAVLVVAIHTGPLASFAPGWDLWLTRGLARGLGIPDRVTSPTFTIVNEYEGGRLPLFHFDMYRLGSADELFDIGWEDYLRRGGVCAVEWSENIADALEEDAVRVDIRRGASDQERVITIAGVSKL